MKLWPGEKKLLSAIHWKHIWKGKGDCQVIDECYAKSALNFFVRTLKKVNNTSRTGILLADNGFGHRNLKLTK